MVARAGENWEMPLERYQEMRDFGKTPEPGSGEQADISEHERAGTPRFVIQEHHATALHWDLRLERNGVLVSWAVPKGIPPDPRVNHLAVQTEDHPLSYFDFEGEIPPGEYGGGRVILWDQGTYETEKWSEREVKFVFHGNRANGRHVLFKTGGKNWMIHRMDPAEDPSRELVPDDLRAVAPEVVDGLPSGDGWRYLVAWGGDDVVVAVEGGRATVWTSKGDADVGRWPVLRRFAAAQSTTQMVVAAQLVATGGRGEHVVLVDDLLYLDGHRTTSLGFDDRRALLEQLDLEGSASADDAQAWKTSPVYPDGELVMEAARAQGLRGVRCQRADATWDVAPLLVTA